MKRALVPIKAARAAPQLAVPFEPGHRIADRRRHTEGGLNRLAQAARDGCLPSGTIEKELCLERLRPDVPDEASDLVLDLHRRLPECGSRTFPWTWTAPQGLPAPLPTCPRTPSPRPRSCRRRRPRQRTCLHRNVQSGKDLHCRCPFLHSRFRRSPERNASVRHNGTCHAWQGQRHQTAAFRVRPAPAGSCPIAASARRWRNWDAPSGRSSSAATFVVPSPPARRMLCAQGTEGQNGMRAEMKGPAGNERGRKQ